MIRIKIRLRWIDTIRSFDSTFFIKNFFQYTRGSPFNFPR